MDPNLQTASLHALLARHQAGDAHALDALIRRTVDRLERLARKMLADFPTVHAREQTADVLQNALIRLTRALGEVTPESVRDYYRLATEQIRRELLDLARWHGRRPAGALGEGELQANSDSEFDRWAAFQEAIIELPTDAREVFGLTFYHGWTQTQIAELFGMSDRQVRRLWKGACLKLYDVVGGDVPSI